MSKIDYVDGIKIIKRKKSGFKKITTIFGILLIFALIYIVSVSFTNITMPVGNFISNLFIKSKNIVNEKKMYAVTLGEYNTIDEANTVAQPSTTLGAGGFVWSENKKYYVIAHIYESNEDAQVVLKNISESGYNCGILEIVLNKVELKNSYSDAQIKILSESFETVFDIITNFYKNTIQLETKEITYVACASFVNEYKSEIKLCESKINTIIASNTNEEIIAISGCFVTLENTLNNAVNLILNNVLTESRVKYCYAEFVNNYYSFINSLKN